MSLKQKPKFRKNIRHVSRSELFPKKVFKEQMWDTQTIWMWQKICEAFPDPKQRNEYIKALLVEMDQPPEEHVEAR